MDKPAVKECSERSLAGSIAFPEVVERLAAAGIDRYRADLVRLETCYYSTAGLWTSSPLAVDWWEQVAEEFSADDVESAVRDIQAGNIQYQEFLRRIILAGCASYTVFIRGRHVVYEGCAGERIIEEFPEENA